MNKKTANERGRERKTPKWKRDRAEYRGLQEMKEKAQGEVAGGRRLREGTLNGKIAVTLLVISRH